MFSGFFSVDLVILLALLVLSLYFYLVRNNSYWKNRGVLYEDPLPFFGNFLNIALGNVSPGEHLSNLYKKFDAPYFGLYALTKPVLVLKDPELIKRILIKDFRTFSDRMFVANETIDPIFSNTLLVIKNPLWKTLRSKLSPFFTSGKLKMMFSLIKECGDDMDRYLMKNLDKSLDVKEMCAKFTTDVIATCAFGIQANCFERENSDFRVAGRRIFDTSGMSSFKRTCYIFAHTIVKVFRFRFIDGPSANFLGNTLWQTIKEREEKQIVRNDLVEILINLKNQNNPDDDYQLYDDRIVAQAVIFFAAGHETTSTTISFTLFELCIHKEMQDRLREEITQTLERHNNEITYEAISEMKYLNMVVSETLRKYSLLPFLNRECLEDYTFPETGLKIEKGTGVIIPVYAGHMNPKYFPDPKRYDPERFSDENKQKIPSGVYMPFGDGPRNCIGERLGLMATKLGIIYAIKSFKLERGPETPDNLEFKPRSPLLVATHGVPLVFQKL